MGISIQMGAQNLKKEFVAFSYCRHYWQLWFKADQYPLLLCEIPHMILLLRFMQVFGTIYPLFSREKEDHVVNSFKIWWHFSCFPRKN